MDGFQLFVTNASTIPPVDHACYNETQGQPYPNISQTIPCNKIGKYVIYYDGTGSDEGGQIYEPSIELCYVAINGCPSTFWGSNCEISCAESCISQSCFPGNGSCIWGGCHDKNCLRSNCEKPAICTDGCNGNRTGPNCDKHNMAFNSSVMFNQIVIDQDSLVNDGDKKSCVKIQQSTERIVVDINETSIVNEIYLHLNVNTNISGNHTIYASNASDLSEHKTVLYNNESSPPTLITTRAVFRYLIYVFPRQDENSLSEICEIGILVSCPRSSYGLLCNETCPQNCKGPCDLDTGICKFGCVSGWIGSKCETGMKQRCKTNQHNMYIQVIQVNPSSGPVYGGTVVTITGKYIGNVTDNIVVAISGVQCHNITVIKPDTRLTCIIGEGNIPQAKGLFVSVNSNNFSDSNTTYFSFKRPRIVNVNPTKGIVSGGTTVTIGGQNIAFEGRNRYNISFCNNEICIECSNLPTALNEPIIKCKTGQSEEPRNMTRLQVVIDDLTNLTLNETFRYLPDPTFNISNEPQKSVQSGGSTFTIRGEGFNNVENITVEKVDKPCDVPDDTLAVCNTPPNLNNETNNQTIIVHFDGLTVHIPIEYVTDPTFERFQGVQDYDKESTITIKVTLEILIPLLSDKVFQMKFNVIIERQDNWVWMPMTKVNVGNIKAYIGDLQYKEDVNTLAFVVGALAAALATAIVIGVSAVVILRKKKKKAIKEFKMELMTREEMIRKASREEFADAQMNIRDIKSDLVTTRVPYSSYQNYILHQLFPNQDISNNPLLHDSEITDDRKAGIKSAIEKFEMLLSNKLFLKSLIQTLDRPNMLTMQEKAHFASVLSISLLGNMRLFFDLVQCLLVDMVRSSTKKQHKVLFRRFDSITMRLMVNWLQIGLYKHLTSRSGIHLFMLYRAVQTIIEMGPIDALTGNSKNTIAEEKLLKMRIEYQSLTLQIDLNGNSDQHYPVKVLDCDTISQVKQKCCAQIYKNKPASEIPHNDELSLEWQQGKAGKLLLNDIDNTSDRNNGLVCLNTLKHYMVQDDSKMALMYKQHDDDDVYVNSTEIRTESVTSEDITLLMPDLGNVGEEIKHKWHLVY
ncbi:PLXNA [Mytilus edulis]|uniref:PLXNA n=1 Tax=Mytilus edulis TaxID=6550 RepID=A0A8S3U5R7_MYTED|nr:PLXNA [Mytilus edulis]